MNRRVLQVGALIGLGALSLAACSSGSEDSKESADGKITLTVATFNEFGYNNLLSEYSKSHPNIKVVEKKAATSNEAHDNMMTRLAAGSGLSDIEAVEVDWWPELMQYPEQPKNKVLIVVLCLLLVLGAAVLAGAGYVAYKAAGASQRASSPTTGKADTKEPASGSTDPAPGNYQLKRNDKVAFLLQGMYKSCAQGESWLQLVDGPAGPRTLHFLPTEPPKGTEKEVSLLCMWKDLGLPACRSRPSRSNGSSSSLIICLYPY